MSQVELGVGSTRESGLNWEPRLTCDLEFT